MFRRLVFLCLFFFTAGAVQAQAADLAGVVTYTSGDAWLLRGQGMRAVPVDTKIFAGDVVVTKRSGRVKLAMQDGSIIYVGGRTRIAVEDYLLKKKSLKRGSFHLLWGKARFLVKKLVESGADFSVRTKTVTVGVRGTQFAVIYPVVDLPKDADIASPGEVKVKPRPTTVMLFEGAVVAKNLKGVEHVIKPGNLARIQADGRVSIRPIRKLDIEDLEIEPIIPEAKVRKPEVKELKDKRPELKKPEVKKPEVEAPEVKAPEVKAPEIKMPEVKAPEIKMPEVKKPEIDD